MRVTSEITSTPGRGDELLNDDEALIDNDRGAEDLDDLSDDGDTSPGDRRRDPLRRTI